MKNAQSRLARLEQRARVAIEIREWAWSEEPVYLAMSNDDQAQIASTIAKMAPFLPDDVKGAVEGLTNEELDRFEAFYIATGDAKAEIEETRDRSESKGRPRWVVAAR